MATGPGGRDYNDASDAAGDVTGAEDRAVALASRPEHAYARDDLLVRHGKPTYDPGVMGRLRSHPSGFRRWFVTHQLVANGAGKG